MPIRTNAYQFYKRCILIAQHNEQRDTPFSLFISLSLKHFSKEKQWQWYLYQPDFDGMFEK